MNKGKDEALTYEELTHLCNKQEKYIKELEDKLNNNVLIPKGTEKTCMPMKPSYEELECEGDRTREQLRKNELLILALEKSLAYMSKQIDNYIDECEYYKEQNYKLRKELEEYTKL